MKRFNRKSEKLDALERMKENRLADKEIESIAVEVFHSAFESAFCKTFGIRKELFRELGKKRKEFNEGR